MWLGIFAGIYFCGLAIFGVLQELISAIRTDWFSLLGINFCDFQKFPAPRNDDICFYWVRAMEIQIFKQYYSVHMVVGQ